jgi:hypothetical protein
MPRGWSITAITARPPRGQTPISPPSSDSRPKGGTGLGLAISKALIEHMDGVIGFAANEGGGTTFYFELPRAATLPVPATIESHKEIAS